MVSLFESTKGIAPQIQEDFQPVDFGVPVSCGAKAKILEAGRKTGVGKTSGKAFDMFFIDTQLTEDILPDDKGKVDATAKNRYMPGIIYFMADTEFSTAADNLLKLKNDLLTIGSPLKEPSAPMEDEDYKDYITNHLMGLKDKIIDVRCYPGKKKEDGTKPQKVKIVNRGEPKSSTTGGNVPF